MPGRADLTAIPFNVNFPTFSITGFLLKCLFCQYLAGTFPVNNRAHQDSDFISNIDFPSGLTKKTTPDCYVNKDGRVVCDKGKDKFNTSPLYNP